MAETTILITVHRTATGWVGTNVETQESMHGQSADEVMRMFTNRLTSEHWTPKKEGEVRGTDNLDLWEVYIHDKDTGAERPAGISFGIEAFV